AADHDRLRDLQPVQQRRRILRHPRQRVRSRGFGGAAMTAWVRRGHAEHGGEPAKLRVPDVRAGTETGEEKQVWADTLLLVMEGNGRGAHTRLVRGLETALTSCHPFGARARTF